MYMLNDLAIEMQRAQSAERHSAVGSPPRPERVRGLMWWRRRHGHHPRADARASQQPVQQPTQLPRSAAAAARPTADIGR